MNDRLKLIKKERKVQLNILGNFDCLLRCKDKHKKINKRQISQKKNFYKG
jgi:hypothetical protein